MIDQCTPEYPDSRKKGEDSRLAFRLPSLLIVRECSWNAETPDAKNCGEKNRERKLFWTTFEEITT
jgi:hypothetical protein